MGARDLLLTLRDSGISVVAESGKLLVTPASALSDEMCTAIREHKPELLALLATTRNCTGCRNLTRAKTCAEPIAAGLIPAEDGFGLAWPDPAQGAACPAYAAKTPVQAQPRPYKLTPRQADVAHAEPWDDAAIARFQARVQRVMRLGFDEQDTEDLAEQLHLRDVHADYRHLCIECSHHRPGRCGNHKAAGLPDANVGRDLAVLLQGCPGFSALASRNPPALRGITEDIAP